MEVFRRGISILVFFLYVNFSVVSYVCFKRRQILRMVRLLDYRSFLLYQRVVTGLISILNCLR